MADKHKPIIILSDSEDEFTASSYSQFKQSPESQIEKDRLLALALQEEELQAVKKKRGRSEIDDKDTPVRDTKRRQIEETTRSQHTPRFSHESLRSPQVFFRPNYLPTLPSSANKGAIAISDIIESTATRAIIGTYKLDLMFLLEECPILWEIPTTVLHGEELEIDKGFLPDNIKIIKPYVSQQWGTFHGKFFIIEYPSYLRVAISSANVYSIDYTRKAQGIWVQDFPKWQQPQSTQTNERAKNFLSTLSKYLADMKQPYDFLKGYDFSAVPVVLVASIPGYHKGNTKKEYGHMCLRHYLEHEPIPPKFQQHSELAIQCSSIGSFSEDKWLYEEFGESLLSSQGGTKTRATARNVQLIWPTVSFVQHCIDGYSAGGSLCFPAKNAANIKNKIWHRYEPVPAARRNIPPHIKTYTRYIAPNTAANPSRSPALAWLFMGSHNLSKAAFGALQKKGEQLHIRSYELGVLFLPSVIADATGKKHVELYGSTEGEPLVEEADDRLTVYIPLPCRLPPTPYTGKDSPWIWDIPYPEPDIFGVTITSE